MPDDKGIYVVVTIAPNGHIHAWGDGPAGPDPDELVAPFATRADARRAAERMRQEDRVNHPDLPPVTYKVCKVLGTEPTPVEP